MVAAKPRAVAWLRVTVGSTKTHLRDEYVDATTRCDEVIPHGARLTVDQDVKILTEARVIPAGDWCRKCFPSKK